MDEKITSMADKIRNMSFHEIVISTECGEFNDLRCLCSPDVREAFVALQARLNGRQLAAFWKLLCGCAVTPAAGTPTPVLGPGVPQPPPVTPVALPPAPPAATATPPPPPASTEKPCDPGLQPPGFYTGGNVNV